MSNLKFWTGSCLVLIVLVFRWCVAKEAIGCYHGNTECQTVLPTCEDTSVIILNDTQWYSKPDCTVALANCEQCCFHDDNDVNSSLSNSDSVDIYTKCHRQPGCDPYTDLQPPTGFQTSYLHIIYTCQPVSSTEADDTPTVSVHVIYAIIFPIIGVCIIVAVACFMKRKVTGQPKSNADDRNGAISNDVHTNPTETKPIEEVFIVSQSSSNHSTNHKATVKFTPRERELYSPDVASDGNIQNDTTAFASNANPGECSVAVESSDGYTTEEEVTVKEPIYDAVNEIAVNDTKIQTASNATTNDTLTSKQKKTSTNNANTNTSGDLASSRNKTDKGVRTKQRNTIDRRKMKRIRMKQLQILRNIKLYWRTKQYEHKLSDSSSDDYSPTSSSFTDSSSDSNDNESAEHDVRCMVNSEKSAKSMSRLRSASKDETETVESRVIGNAIVDTGKGEHASLNGIKTQTVRETLNEVLYLQPDERLRQIMLKYDDISSDTDSSSGSLHSRNMNKRHIFAHTPIATGTLAREEYALENTYTACNESHVPKEGPVATSSIKYTQDEKIPYVQKYDMAKCFTNDRNHLSNKTPISVWCLPKPPDTKPELQFSAKQSAEILNRSMSLNESDKRRDEVLDKRRKRKYESMRHAKRETIFEILQKLQAVPKGGILKKSKSMNVGKRGIGTDKRQENVTDSNEAAFEDESNLTDSDKIHKLIEPQGQLVSEVQSCTKLEQENTHDLGIDKVPVNTPHDKYRNEIRPADSVSKIHQNNSKAVTSDTNAKDNHQCDIISSNLRRNSSVETDKAVKDTNGNTIIDTDMVIEDEQDATSSQRQANIRHKLLRRPVPKSYSLNSSSEQKKNTSTLLLHNEPNGINHSDTESENELSGFSQHSANGRFPNSAKHYVPIRHSRRDATDDSYLLESGIQNSHRQYSQIITPGSAVGQHTSPVPSSSSEQSDDSLTHVTESDKLDGYHVHTRPDTSLDNRSSSTGRHNNPVPKSLLGDRSRSIWYPGSEYDNLKDYSMPTQLTTLLGNQSMSNERNDTDSDSNTDFQIPTRPKSSLGNRSKSTGILESDQNEDYHIQTFQKSSSGNRLSSNGSNDSEKPKNYQIHVPTRSKSFHGNRQSSPGRNDYVSDKHNDGEKPMRPKSSLVADRSRSTEVHDSESNQNNDYLGNRSKSNGSHEFELDHTNDYPKHRRPKSSLGNRSKSNGTHYPESNKHNSYQNPTRRKSSLDGRSMSSGSIDSESDNKNDYKMPLRPKSSLGVRSRPPDRHNSVYDKHNEYQPHLHPKSSLDYTSMSPGRHNSDFEQLTEYQKFMRPKSPPDSRSKSNERHYSESAKQNNDYHIPMRPKSPLRDQSMSRDSHESKSDKTNDDQMPTRSKSSLGNRSKPNGRHDSKSDEHNKYKIPTRSKSSLVDRSKSYGRQDSEYEKHNELQIPTRPKSSLRERSRSIGSHNSESKEHNEYQIPSRSKLSLDSRPRSNDSEYEKHNEHQIPTRPKSSLGDLSISNESHSSVSNEHNDYQVAKRPKSSLGDRSRSSGSDNIDFDKVSDNQIPTRPKSSLGDRSRSNRNHDLEFDKQNEYGIHMRPQTSLGNPSLSTSHNSYLYHYHQQHREESALQSARKSVDTGGNKPKGTDFKYKLPSDNSHLKNVPKKSSRSQDTTVLTDNTLRNDSPGQKSIDRRGKKSSDHKQRHMSRKDEKAKVRKTIKQSLNKIAGVSGQTDFKSMETYDSALTPYSTMPYNLENKDYYTSQYSKSNKYMRSQSQPSEIYSRPSSSLKKSNQQTNPPNVQEQTTDNFGPHRRSKTPTSVATFSNQHDSSTTRGSVERNLFTNFESKLPPYSYSGNKNTSHGSKLYSDIDPSLNVKEQIRMKSQEEDSLKLLNRRFKDSNRVNDNRESNEPVRERPKSAMFGRYSGRPESRSALQRNKSMSQPRDANIPSIRNGNSYSSARSSTRDSQRTDSSTGQQGLMAGWSRWNHPVDISPDWHRQSTSGTADVLLEEYDSEIENFFSNPDAEVLEISKSPRNNRTRSGVSRSKSCKT